MQLRGLFFQIFHFVKKFIEEPPLKLIKLHLLELKLAKLEFQAQI